MASIPAPSDPLRLGLIGAGRWGRVILRNLAGMDGVTLAAIASANPETAALAPPGCAIETDWRRMLERVPLDGLIIAAPPAVHAEMAEAAIRRRLAVLVEKPLTLDLAQAVALEALAEANPCLVQVGHVHLCAPAWRALKRLGASLGPLRSIDSEAGNRGPWRADAAVLWDWGPHDLAMGLDLIDSEPNHLDARFMSRRPEGAGWAETLELALSFGAVSASIRLSNDIEKRRWFKAEFQGGTLVYDDLAAHRLTLDGQACAIAPDLPLGVQLSEFAAAIRAGSTDRAGLALGRKVVGLLARFDAILAGR